MKSDNPFQFNRRQFLKISGAVSAALGTAGLGWWGYKAGKDPSTYTGCGDLEGMAQSFNRKRFAQDLPPYEKVGPSRRIDTRTEMIFSRMGKFQSQWDDKKGVDGLDEILQNYYKAHPEDLEVDLQLIHDIYPKRGPDAKKHKREFILTTAWSNAMGSVWPESVHGPPEKSDFPNRERGERHEPLKMKSAEKTSKLIKKMAHQFGATLVGITKLNPDWVYDYPMPWRGFTPDQPFEIPKHWEYAIVVGTPMSWDPMFANPNYGTSYDAYAKSRIVATCLTAFIKQLGYPARAHTPGMDYDLMVTPIVIDAGLGEQGRHGVVVTPELGSNFRPAVVTTNISLKTDRPISFGVKDFCRTCKICAEQCPSGAITKGDMVEVRGYRRYQIHASKCHNFWYANLGNMGCRLCVSVCPYTRKANWLHRSALQVTANDPTGLSHKVLTGLQKVFYPGPDPKDYYIPSMGGRNASYRKPPWWLRTDDFIENDA